MHVVVGGVAVGEAMVAHPGIDKIQFVGSGAVAKKVLKNAAETLKPCGLELGGKSAVIVFEDAILKDATRRGLSGAISANGGKAIFVRADVTVERDIEAMVAVAMNGFGRLDAAFNNVGHPGYQCDAHETTTEQWDHVASIDLRAAWLSVKYERSPRCWRQAVARS